MRVLLADDNRELRETTAELLGELPAEVEKAADGRAAWRLFRAAPEGFALVATDLDMPGMDGRELARRVRGLRPSCPILFITSRSGDERLRALEGDGPTEILAKPFSPEELHRAALRTIAGAPGELAAADRRGADRRGANRRDADRRDADRRDADRRPLLRAWPLAAAAVLVVGVALYRAVDEPPALPQRPDALVLRSTAVAAVGPVGDVELTPESLRWRSVEGASAYRATLSRVDGRTVFEATSGSTAAELPADIIELLRPGVTFLWSVEARGPDGRVLARSETLRFRVRLPSFEER